MPYNTLQPTMADNKEKWKMLRQKMVYDHFFRLYEEEVKLPTGETLQYTVNRSGDAAAVLLSPEPNMLLVTYQYRYPINKWIYDLPGGKVQKKESPQDAAMRECIEETGYKPLHIQKLVQYHPMPSRSDGTLHIFFSDAAEKMNQQKSSHSAEDTYAKILSGEEVQKLIRNNTIVDPALLIAWYTARSYGLV